MPNKHIYNYVVYTSGHPNLIIYQSDSKPSLDEKIIAYQKLPKSEKDISELVLNKNYYNITIKKPDLVSEGPLMLELIVNNIPYFIKMMSKNYRIIN